MYQPVSYPEPRKLINGRYGYLVALCALGLFAWSWHSLQPFLTLDFLQHRQHAVAEAYRLHPWLASAVFLGLVTLCSAMAIPGTVLFCLAAGAIFGVVWGVLLVSLGTAIGATASFWAARLFWRSPIQRRFAHRLHAINQGVSHRGGWYLLSLRLTPVIPFAVINLLLGLTHMRTLKFYLVTQVGMLAPIGVYVNAGRQLTQLHQLSDVFNPTIVVSFVLLGVLPLVATWFQRKRPASVPRD